MGVSINQYASLYTASGTVAPSVVYAYPFYVNQPYRVRNLWWFNGIAVGGSASMGIYNTAGSLLVGGAATAVSGLSQGQYYAVDYTLPIGGYYAAWTTDSSTTQLAYFSPVAATRLDFCGLAQYVPGVSTLPMPSSLTFAPFAQNRLPIFGLSRNSTL